MEFDDFIRLFLFYLIDREFIQYPEFSPEKRLGKANLKK